MRQPALIPLVLFFLLFAGSASPAGAAASLVADVNRFESFDLPPAVRGPIVPLGSKVLFLAEEPGSGWELWVSDGTSPGTELLRDFCPGSCSWSFVFLGTIRDRIAVFETGDDRERRLWRTDGTRRGTFPLSADPLSLCSTTFVALGSAGFFSAEGPFGGCALWKTDGTADGTRPVGAAGAPSALARAGDRFFFLGTSSLWISDGTSGGTALLRSWSGEGRILAAVGSKLLFIAPETGDELWVSDGTPAGTKPVTSFAAPEPFGVTGTVEVLDGVAYFLVDDVTGGTDLWRSDGTQAGTRRVTAFGNATPFLDFLDEPVLELVKTGDRLVFVADDGLTGRRLWTSRGTPETTAAVACPGACPFLDGRPVELAALGDRVFFAARDSRSGSELWSTDPGVSGLRLFRDLCPGGCNSRPQGFIVAGGALFFVAFSSEALEILKTDGTAAGTVRLATLGQGNTFGGEDFRLAQAGGRFFFTAESEGRPLQLWTGDGTPAGTRPVTVIGFGDGSDPRFFAALGNRLFFVACSDFVQKLWGSDPAGAVSVSPEVERNCTLNGGDLEGLAASGSNVFFRDESQDALWRTDGTEAGTIRLTPEEFREVRDLVPFKGGVVFPVWDGNQFSLWTSNGTVAGTRRLFEWPQAALFLLGDLGPDLYFVSSPNSSGDRQLFATDGTAAAPRAIAPLPGFRPLPPVTARVGNRLYFLGGSSVLPEIWSTDGTEAGTRQLELPEAAFAREILGLAELGGALFFLASVEPEEGGDLQELWRTDGTTAGTSRVRVLGPREDLSGRLVSAGGRLYFAANDGEHGVELWESDGTEAGTRMVEDVAPGPSSSHPNELTPAGDRLYFAADDGVHGREPWVLPLGSTACQPSDFVLCLGGGRFKVEADWRDFDGNSGRGHAVSLTADTGYFWFFGAANVEVILKVLDGRGVNDHHWVFYGALSTVRYVLTVTDTQTGAARRYINPPGLLGGRPVNGKFWIFYGALSSVEYTLTVTDTMTGARKVYSNPSGRLASGADTGAF